MVWFEVLTAVVMKSSSFVIWSRVARLKPTEVSDEHVASIFRVEEQASMKACG
jgi:hypothetical protein